MSQRELRCGTTRVGNGYPDVVYVMGTSEREKAERLILQTHLAIVSAPADFRVYEYANNESSLFVSGQWLWQGALAEKWKIVQRFDSRDWAFGRSEADVRYALRRFVFYQSDMAVLVWEDLSLFLHLEGPYHHRVPLSLVENFFKSLTQEYLRAKYSYDAFLAIIAARAT
jgi:hypothetical protein